MVSKRCCDYLALLAVSSAVGLCLQASETYFKELCGKKSCKLPLSSVSRSNLNGSLTAETAKRDVKLKDGTHSLQ